MSKSALFSFALITSLICIMFAQTNHTKHEIFQEDKFKEEKFQESLDSLVALSKLQSNTNQWDSFYVSQKNIFFLAKEYNKFNKILKIVEDNTKLIPDKEALKKSQSYLLIGLVHDRLGNIFKAEEYNLKALSYFPQHQDSALLQRCYNQSGIFKIKTNEYNEAIIIFSKSIVIAKKRNDSIYLAKNYKNLGIAFLWAGEYDKARNSLLQSNIFQADPSGATETYFAKSYIFENKTTEALDQCSIALKKSLKANDVLVQFQSLSLYGEIYFNLKKYRLALDYLTKALELTKDIEEKREVAKTIFIYAKSKIQIQEFDSALSKLDEAIDLLGYNRRMEYGKILPSELHLIEYFAEKGNCYVQKNKLVNNPTNLVEAQINYDRSIEIITDMRQFTDNPKTIEEISKNSKLIFQKSIENSIALHKIDEKKHHLGKIFLNMQKFSAFNLRKNVSLRNAINKAINDTVIKNSFLLTRTTLLNAEYKLLQQYTDEGYDEYNTAKNKFIHLRDSLEKSNRLFHKYNNILNIYSVSEVQSKLNDNEVFVQYFSGSDKLITISIYKNDIKSNIISNDTTFKNNLQNYLTLLNEPVISDNAASLDSINRCFMQSAHFLYSALIEPITKEKSIKKIIVVPDGPLFRVPFESLAIEKNGAIDDAKAFLLSKHTVNYFYYTGQYFKQSIPNISDYFIGFGLEYDFYTLERMKEYNKDTSLLWIKEKFKSDNLSHLYFADDEVISISKYFKGRTFTNEKATKYNLLKHINNAGILHISAHSCIDYVNPQNSAIVLSKNGPHVDNLLRSDDIVKSDLQSQLVILSACNSASGKVSEAEGVSSLTKSFFEAGSQSVLGTYWSVPDEISKIFMEAFYEKLKSGKPIDTALRETKLEFITTNTLVNPYYKRPQFWSAWTLYGDVQPLKVNDYKYWWIAFTVMALGLIPFLFWRRRSAELV